MVTSRGRRRAFDRDDVLEQVTLAFWDGGYDATSVANLTQITGVNPPSLYATFGDKQALFAEVVSHYQQTYGAFATRALTEESTARAAVHRMLCEAAAAYTDPSHPKGCLVISAANDTTGASADVAASLRRLREAGMAAIEAKIQHDIDRGILPEKTDAHGLAAFYASTVRGMSGQARDGATLAELATVCECAMRAWPED
jgi:AcrR family transcriptional regulator